VTVRFTGDGSEPASDNLSVPPEGRRHTGTFPDSQKTCYGNNRINKCYNIKKRGTPPSALSLDASLASPTHPFSATPFVLVNSAPLRSASPHSAPDVSASCGVVMLTRPGEWVRGITTPGPTDGRTGGGAAEVGSGGGNNPTGDAPRREDTDALPARDVGKVCAAAEVDGAGSRETGGVFCWVLRAVVRCSLPAWASLTSYAFLHIAPHTSRRRVPFVC